MIFSFVISTGLLLFTQGLTTVKTFCLQCSQALKL